MVLAFETQDKSTYFFILFLTIHPIFFSIMSTKEQPISNVFFINQTYICKILRHEYVGGEHYLLLNPGQKVNNISGLQPELSRRKGRFEVYFCQTAYPWPLVARVHSLPEEHQETSPSLIHIFLPTTAAYKLDFSSKTRTPDHM